MANTMVECEFPNNAVRLAAVFCTLFLSCILDPDIERMPDPPHRGMVKIMSLGETFLQGWNDSLAAEDERPGMATTFTYNYWLDTTEVTQRQFASIVGRNPVPENSQYGYGDNFPVYNVSWYDAALYCNARSRADSLDTVYVYTEKKTFANGGVYDLIGLRADFSRDGYRLPTEAEWEFAARQSSSKLQFSKWSDTGEASLQAWWSGNSGNCSHLVAMKGASAPGLYDMAGNVFEWTNDWKCAYTGRKITNSLGGMFSGGSYEKAVKGGSYRDGIIFLRPSHRGTEYATIVSSVTDYIGFRCARGIIPDGRYIGQEGHQDKTNPVTVAAVSAAVRSFTGANVIRIVFVNATGNDRTLCTADFSNNIPGIREYKDDRNVHLPAISPDGRYVAYCSGSDGCDGPSTVTIRSLDSLLSPRTFVELDSAYYPRWWINPAGGDTMLLLTNSAIADDNQFWMSTKTYVQKMSGGKPLGSAVEIVHDGGFHDGRSANSRFLITSYPRLIARNYLTGINIPLFQFPHNGKNKDGSTQVCNASISPDTGDNPRYLFLDFGYPKTSAITGTSYGVHRYLFIGTMTDTIVGYLDAPEGEESWEYPEWTNQPRFAVSAVKNGADQTHAIHLVDLAGKKSIRIISGCELRDPCCHIGPLFANAQYLSIDSLGRYDDPWVNGGQDCLNYKLHLFWQRRSTLECVFLGQSYIYCGIDCAAIKHMSALNMGFISCGLIGYSSVIAGYILPHAPKIRVIGMNVPFDFFAKESCEETPDYFSGSTGQSKGYLYDLHHNFWRNGIPSDFVANIKTISDAPLLQILPFDTLGYVRFSCYGWGDTNPGCWGSTAWTVQDSNYRKNVATLIKLIEMVSSHGIHLLMINVPQTPYCKNAPHYFCSGPSWETARAVLSQLKSLESRYQYFHLYDAHNGGNHDYTDADAYNLNHLCETGAQKLTKRVDSLLLTILSAVSIVR